MTQKQYLPYLDYAKVIGIFLVVYDHVMGYSPTPDAVAMYNKSFLMPMFFLISGILYRPLSLKETLRKDWHTLIVPYLLLNAICWLPQLAIYLLKGTFTFSNIYSNLGAIVLGLGYSTGGFNPESSPCWFIYVLFLARVLISLLPQKSNRYMLGLTALSILATIALQYFHIDLYVPFDSAFLALPFVCVGYVFREQIKADIARKGAYNILSILVLATVWFCSVGYNGWVDTNSCVVGKSLVVYYLSGFFGAISLLKIANCLKNIPEKVSGGKIAFKMLACHCRFEFMANHNFDDVFKTNNPSVAL